MNRINFRLISAVTGILLTLFGVILLIAPTPTVFAQSEEDEREYVGRLDCASCHREIGDAQAETPHASALIDVERHSEGMLADFSTGDDVRQVQFPGEDEPRAFTADDIAFAIGSGRYIQRYLYQSGEDEYLVLPAEWNTEEHRWQSFELSETWPDPAYDWNTECAYCHTTGFDLDRGRWEDDGVQCEACHGPGSEHVDLVDRIFEVPTGEQRTHIEASINIGLDGQVCGQCHSRGIAPDNIHPFPIDYRPGDDLQDPAIFHLPSSDDSDYWWGPRHAAQPNMQYNEWVLSAHTESFADLQDYDNFQAGCLSCHSDAYTRAERRLARIEANGDRDWLTNLFTEANLPFDVGEDEPIDWNALRRTTLDELDVDPSLIDDSQPFLPQILPYLIERTQSEGTLETGTVLPQRLATTLALATDPTTDAHTQQALSVTCAVCHDPHSTTDYPAAIVDEPYALCTSCHQNVEPFAPMHHPVREMFEGEAVVQGIPGVAGVHFSAEEGPRCTTCHMPEVPVDGTTRISHAFMPVPPAENEDGLRSTCAGCHGELTENDLRYLIQDTQEAVKTRIDAAFTQLGSLSEPGPDDATREQYDRIVAALDFVQSDGSLGIHNYVYADSLLSAAEQGLSELNAPVVAAQPTEAAPTAAPSEPLTTTVSEETETVPSGLRPVTFVLIGFALFVLLIAAVAFFRKPQEREV